MVSTAARSAAAAMLALLSVGCPVADAPDQAQSEATASATPAATEGIASQEVYAQSPAHPARAYARVSGVSVEGERLVVEVGLANASTRTLSFAAAGVTLTDASGSTYALIPPEDNPTLDVQAGALLAGALVFDGVPSAGSALEVRFNDGSAQDTEAGGSDELTDTPALTVDGFAAPG